MPQQQLLRATNIPALKPSRIKAPRASVSSNSAANNVSNKQYRVVNMMVNTGDRGWQRMRDAPHAPEETSPSTEKRRASTWRYTVYSIDTVFEFEPRESTHDSSTRRHDTGCEAVAYSASGWCHSYQYLSSF